MSEFNQRTQASSVYGDVTGPAQVSRGKGVFLILLTYNYQMEKHETLQLMTQAKCQIL